jgi:hypothetical protein
MADTIIAGQQAEQELERARAEAESALQSARDDAAQAQQRVQQLEVDVSQMRSSYESVQQVLAWRVAKALLGWLSPGGSSCTTARCRQQGNEHACLPYRRSWRLPKLRPLSSSARRQPMQRRGSSCRARLTSAVQRSTLRSRCPV